MWKMLPFFSCIDMLEYFTCIIFTCITQVLNVGVGCLHSRLEVAMAKDRIRCQWSEWSRLALWGRRASSSGPSLARHERYRVALLPLGQLCQRNPSSIFSERTELLHPALSARILWNQSLFGWPGYFVLTFDMTFSSALLPLVLVTWGHQPCQ